MTFNPGDRVRISFNRVKATIVREMFYIKGTWVVIRDDHPTKEVCYPAKDLEKIDG